MDPPVLLQWSLRRGTGPGRWVLTPGMLFAFWGGHFIAGCYMLEAVRVNFKDQSIAILSWKNPLNVINEVLSNPKRLIELILDCSVTVNRQTPKLDEDMVREVEQLSRNMCYSLHQKHCEILGLILRK